MPDTVPKPLPPFEPITLRAFVTAVAKVLAVITLGVVLAATIVRIPACSAKEPAHAWQR